MSIKFYKLTLLIHVYCKYVTDLRILQVPYYLTALPILANGLLLKNDLPPKRGCQWEYPVLSQLLIFRPVLS